MKANTSPRARPGRLLGALLAVMCVWGSLAGCYRRIEIVDRFDGGLTPRDARPGEADASSARDWVEPMGRCLEASSVDLLVVIDSSSSMTEEQMGLATAFPNLVRALLSPPDEDGDGLPDWPAITDLHIGVVTTDLGADDFPVATCPIGRGDDGILRTTGAPGIAGCAATYPSFLTFNAGGDVDALATDFTCVGTVGTRGCGFEQPLEAALEAIAVSRPTAYTLPTYVPPLFAGRAGHGDSRNAGFVRADSLLAVLVVTDEEDCSLADRTLLDPSSPIYAGVDTNLRCFSFPEALHPVERYLDGLLALRARRQDQLAFALLAGVPVDLTTALPSREDLDAVLSDPRMQERVDPDSPMRMVASCTSASGQAFPPRRMVRLAQSLGQGRSTVQSICDADYASQAAAIGRLFGRRACAARMDDTIL